MSQPGPDPNSSEALYRQLLQAVDEYFHALHEGNVAGLEEAFHPLAKYATASGESPRILGLGEYLDVVRHRVSPKSLGDPAIYHITSIQLAGTDAAVVTLRSRMMERHFEDFLSFLRIEGRWRIIAKVFHFHPIKTTGE